MDILSDTSEEAILQIKKEYENLLLELDPKNKILIDSWEDLQNKYKEKNFKFKVRDKELSIQTHSKSLSQTDIPKIALPKYEAWGDILIWQLTENVPGEFPFTSGLFPFKREGEDPKRCLWRRRSERTNKRFH